LAEVSEDLYFGCALPIGRLNDSAFLPLFAFSLL